MSPEAKIKEMILLDAEIVSGVANRVYQRGGEPSGVVFPHVSFFEITGSPVVPGSNLQHTVWQVDIWARDYPTARHLADRAVKALDGKKSTVPEIVSLTFRSEAYQLVESFHQYALTFDMDHRKE